MRAALAFAGAELRLFLRDRSNIFFAFIFPIVLVLLIGTQFGSGASDGRVLVVGESSTLRAAVLDALDQQPVAVRVADLDEAREELARGRADAAVVLDAAAVAGYESGTAVRAQVFSASTALAPVTEQSVATALQAVAARLGQQAALSAAGVAPGVATAALAGAQVPPAQVRIEDTDRIAQAFSGVTGADVGAGSQTLLFVFLSALTGSTTLIQARKQGVITRALSAPIRPAVVIGGQVLGRWVVALFQGVYIMVGTWLLFGVRWGNPLLIGLVVAVFALVAAAVGILLGSLLDNEGAASGVGVGVSLVLAALGGCMFPLDLFSDGLRRIAHLTPHAWAYDAIAAIQRHGAGLVDVLPQLGVLAAFAVVLLAGATWALRRSLERAL